MENGGSINPNDVATLSLLRPGYGLYGGGYGAGSYASVGSVQHGIANNNQAIENQADCTREVLGNNMDNNARAFESANVQRQFERVCDRISQGELRNGDRLRDIEREMSANAREAAKCCCEAKLEAQKNACDTQKLIIAENTKTRELILAVESRANLDKLAECRAENQALKARIHHPVVPA